MSERALTAKAGRKIIAYKSLHKIKSYVGDKQDGEEVALLSYRKNGLGSVWEYQIIVREMPQQSSYFVTFFFLSSPAQQLHAISKPLHQNHENNA